MQGGKNWILLKEMSANRFFWDSHWLEIWKNHLFPSMGPNRGSVAMDSGLDIPKDYLSGAVTKHFQISIWESLQREKRS